ncbi:hypothetical protein ACOSQ4_030443 [Xanthoceras sorbifolium]
MTSASSTFLHFKCMAQVLLLNDIVPQKFGADLKFSSLLLKQQLRKRLTLKGSSSKESFFHVCSLSTTRDGIDSEPLNFMIFCKYA